MRRPTLIAAVTVGLATLAAFAVIAVRASAVTGTAPVTTLDKLYTGATDVTYTFSGYTSGFNQTVTGVTMNFPPNTDVTAARAVAPAGQVVVAGQQVDYTFSPPIAKGAAITISIGGIGNPSVPATQTAGSIVFHSVKQKGQPLADETLPTGTYTVVPPHLDLTIAPLGLSFGALDPGVTTAEQTVTVTVDSSHPYDISRTMANDAPLLGLTVSGEANGSYFPAGIGSHVDSYTVSVPWDTAASDVGYTATVIYTVTQLPTP